MTGEFVPRFGVLKNVGVSARGDASCSFFCQGESPRGIQPGM